MICFAFVKIWSSLVPLRLVLGIFEAGFFPGCAYLLSTWYPRYELQKRNAVFYLIGSMASAFAGILSYGLMQMNGLADLSGWRWIFIVSQTYLPFSLFAGRRRYMISSDTTNLRSKG